MSLSKEIFNKLSLVEPSENLHQSILSRIELYQKAKLFRLKVSYCLTVALSSMAIIPLSHLVIQSINQSGLYQFLSLIFTDFDVVANQWQSFVLSIIESLPTIEIATLLLLALFIVWTISEINNIHLKNKLLQIKIF